MADLDYVRVVGRFGIVVRDEAADDPNLEPDTVWCDSGTVLFTPLVTAVKVANATPVPATLGQSVIEGTIDSEGYLSLRGTREIQFVDLGSTKVNPFVAAGKATHKVEFVGLQANGDPVSLPSPVNVRLSADMISPLGTIDLTLVMPVPVAGGTAQVVGPAGPSAYEGWLIEGNTGTFDDFMTAGFADNESYVSALLSAQNAADSATAALASETAAAASASAAATSEANALSSKNAAATSATNAATSEANALSSKNAAATSATNAATSEANALSSKNAAATSATNAATSETNALASKNAAATSETNAATSATNSATSATSASGSATTATTKANEAAASASQAATSASGATAVAVSGAMPIIYTNLITNPSFEVDLTGWTAQTNASITRVTTDKYHGSAAMMITKNNTNTISLGATISATVTAGKVYTASFYYKNVTGSAKASLNLGNGGVLAVNGGTGVGSANAVATTTDGTWRRLVVTYTAGSSPAFVPFVGSTASSGEQILFDAFVLVEGNVSPDYFDGTTRGCYWTGTANASTSIKYALDAADTAALNLAEVGRGSGLGSPQGAVAAPVGARYVDTLATNGIQEWVKVYGADNNGWFPTVDVSAVSDTNRVNLCTNPSFEVNTTGISGANATFTQTSEQAFSGNKSIKAVSTSTNNVFFAVGSGLSTYAVVNPGTVYTVSGYVYPSGLTGKTARAEVQFLNSAGTNLGTYSSPYTSISSNVWNRLTHTVIAPAGAVYARPGLTVSGVNGSAGTPETYYFDAYQMEQGPAATAYFDGDSNPVENGTRWSGTPNLSSSYSGRTYRASDIWDLESDLGLTYKGSKTLEAFRLENLLENPSFETVGTIGKWFARTAGATAVKSTAQARSGSSSLAVTCVDGANSVASGGVSNSSSVMPGQPYTGTIYINPGAITGKTAFASLEFFNDSGGGITTSSNGATVSLNAGWNRLIATGIAPAGAVRCRLNFSLLNMTAGNVVYADDAMLHLGAAPVDYADGDTVGWSWGGSRHSSTSFRVPTTSMRESLGIPNRLSGAIEAPRVNLCPNPRFTSFTGWNSGTTTVATVSVSTDTSYLGGSSLKITGVTTGTASIRMNSGQINDITPGVEYTGSVYVNPGTLTNASVTPRVAWYLASGGTASNDSSPITLPANTWTRVSATGVCPQGASSGTFGAVFNITGAGEVAYIDAAQFERGPVATPYFDGNVSPTALAGGRWTGTPGASSSRAGNQIYSGDVYQLKENFGLTGPQAKTVEAPRIENLIRTPTAKYGVGSFVSNGVVNLSVGVASTGGLLGSQVLTMTPTAAGISGNFMEAQWNSTGPSSATYVIPGETYTASVWVNPGNVSGISAQVNYRYYNQAGGAPGAFVGTFVSLPTNTWTRVSTSTNFSVSNAGGNTNGLVAVIPRLGIAGMTNTSDVVKVDGAMFHLGDRVLDYFDGDTSGYSWEGIPGNSISFKHTATKLSTALGFDADYRQALQAPRTNMVQNPGLEYSTVNWAAQSNAGSISTVTTPTQFGTRSLVWTATGAASQIVVGPANTVPVTPGVTYTFSVYVHTGVNTGKTGRISLTWHVGTSSTQTDSGATYNLTDGGWTRISATFTAPAGVNNVRAIVQVTNSANGEIYYADGALLEASPYVLPYFDGDTSGARWTGTPHRSQSRTGSQPLAITDIPELTQVISRDEILFNTDFGLAQRSTGSDIWSAAAGFGTQRTADGCNSYMISGVGTGLGYFQIVNADMSLNRGAKAFRHVVTSSYSSNVSGGWFNQHIEDVTRLAGRTVTLSAHISSTVDIPGCTFRFVQQYGTGGSASGNLNQTFDVYAGSRLYSMTVTLPSTSGKTVGVGSYNQIGFLFPGSIPAGAVITMTGPQLDLGSSPLPYRVPDRATSDARARRYFQRITPISGEILATGYVATANTATFTMPLPVVMRGTPAFSFPGSTTIDYQIVVGNTAYNASAISNNNSTAQKIGMTVNTGSTLTVGQACGLRWQPVTFTVTDFTAPNSDGISTLTYLAGSSQLSPSYEISVSGAANAANNGVFRVSSTGTVTAGSVYSVSIFNPNAVAATGQSATLYRVPFIDMFAEL